MKNIKSVEIVCVLLFMLMCIITPDIMTRLMGFPEGNILVTLFRVLGTLGLIFGSILVILLVYAMHKTYRDKKKKH